MRRICACGLQKLEEDPPPDFNICALSADWTKIKDLPMEALQADRGGAVSAYIREIFSWRDTATATYGRACSAPIVAAGSVACAMVMGLLHPLGHHYDTQHSNFEKYLSYRAHPCNTMKMICICGHSRPRRGRRYIYEDHSRPRRGRRYILVYMCVSNICLFFS